MLNNTIRQKRNITSVVELFIMFLLLLVVIVVITMVCMTTRQQSLHAHSLNEAVICAENVAELTKTAANAEEAAQMLGDMDGVSDISTEQDRITATYEDYTIEINLTPDTTAPGIYVDEDIDIYEGAADDKTQEGEDALYHLHTGYYSR